MIHCLNNFHNLGFHKYLDFIFESKMGGSVIFPIFQLIFGLPYYRIQSPMLKDWENLLFC